MKKLVFLLTAFLFSNAINAQSDCRGYVGLSGGPVFILGNEIEYIDNGVGLGINFGYLITSNIGITSSIFRTNFPCNIPYPQVTVGLAGILVGPLFSTTETGNVEIDFRPTIGYAYGRLLGETSTSSVTTGDYTLAFGVGGTVRWNCLNRISLSANLDYLYGKPKNEYNDRIDLSSFGFSIGVNYRLK